MCVPFCALRFFVSVFSVCFMREGFSVWPVHVCVLDEFPCVFAYVRVCV